MDQKDEQGENTPADSLKGFDEAGIVTRLGEVPPGSIITEEGLAVILGRHPVSIKRAVERGELPPPVRLLGKPVWTASFVLNHLEGRLRKAGDERKRDERRISQLRP
mgnify:CR=1 FL=1